MSLSLSIIINTKNAALTLANTLRSVSNLKAEIIVVDMKSLDKTVEIAEKYGATVFQHKDEGFVEPSRNFAINKATHDWILILDADEELSKPLSTLIESIVTTTDGAAAYYLPRKNEIFGTWIAHTGWWPDYQLRLFKKGVVTWSDAIHSQPDVTVKPTYLEANAETAIIHHNYESVDHFLEKLQTYTTITAEQSENKKATSLTVLKAFRQEFLKRLFLDEGLKDKHHGVILSLLQAMYQGVVQTKVWEKNKGPQTSFDESAIINELEDLTRELRYWTANWRVLRSTGVKKIYWQCRRKLCI